MLAAADALLIPLQCEYYALEGLSQAVNTVHLHSAQRQPGAGDRRGTSDVYDARLNLSRQVAAEAREYFGNQFSRRCPRNVRLARRRALGSRSFYMMLVGGSTSVLSL